MPEIPDPVGAWRDAAGQLQRVAGALADQAGHGARDVLGPLQRQSELIEQLLRRQLDLEQELARRALAPARATVEALNKAPDTMRAQAGAFRTAAAAFQQAAELLDLQAAAIEESIRAITAPLDVARHGLGRRSDPTA